MICFGNRRLFLLISFVACALFCGAQEKKKEAYAAPETVLIITPRVNSAGHFPFTGSLLNTHVNADLNIFYERRRTGFFLFKSVDLVDAHSGVNYFQQGLFRKFEWGRRWQMRAFVGYLFNQTQSFSDDDSDYYTAAAVYWTVNENLKVENTALFFDLSQSKKLANRMLISYFWKGFKLDVYIWHRWELERSSHATSASVAVGLPKIKITNKLVIQNTISYQGYLSAEKPSYAMRQGLLVSVAFPVNASR